MRGGACRDTQFNQSKSNALLSAAPTSSGAQLRMTILLKKMAPATRTSSGTSPDPINCRSTTGKPGTDSLDLRNCSAEREQEESTSCVMWAAAMRTVQYMQTTTQAAICNSPFAWSDGSWVCFRKPARACRFCWVGCEGRMKQGVSIKFSKN